MKKQSDVLERHREKLLSLPNVVGVGVGEKRVRDKGTGREAIVVLVSTKVRARDLPKGKIVPHRLEDVETDVIEVGDIRLLGRTDRVRPAWPGSSIGHYQVTAGTFGAVVYDGSQTPFILSNNHVLANASDGTDGRSSIGDPILQPGSYDGGTLEDQIAELHTFIPLVKMKREATCPLLASLTRAANTIFQAAHIGYRVSLEMFSGKANIVDAALGRVLDEDMVTDSIYQIGEPVGSADPVFGASVKKSGRTTGLTTGSILAVDVTLQVQITQNEFAMFDEQVITNMRSRGGDSGSLVLDEKNRAVGLLFAGSNLVTVFNKFSNVEKLLGISITHEN